MHLKRQKAPKKWPIARKGTTFVVRPLSNFNKGLPLLIALRDILKIARTRKEVKNAINSKHILINSKPSKDDKDSVVLFDTITIVPENKSYIVTLAENGKFIIEETKGADAGKKISKVMNKKILKGKKTQLNLFDGNNFISDIKCNVDDSVIINFKSKKIEKCLPLKEKSKVFVFEGKHAGKSGIINKIDYKHKMAELNVKDSILNVLIKQIMAVE